MKKKHLLLLLIILITFGCNLLIPVKNNPKIRFKNTTNDIPFEHGLKMGGAEFLFSPSNSFMPGEVTDYKTTEDGVYLIQVENGNGDWRTLFPINLTISNGGEYTLIISDSDNGDNSTNIKGLLVTDKMP